MSSPLLCARCAAPVSPERAKGENVCCETCGERISATSNRAYRTPDSLELEAPGEYVSGPWRMVGHVATPYRINYTDTSAIKVPAAAPQAPKDPDKALTSFALGLFRVRGWPCVDLEGYRAFAATVGFRNPVSHDLEVCNITVSACGGVLTFETVLHELPPPPWQPLRETLNAANARSGGSVFLLRECGVVVRLKLIPRPEEQGKFSAAVLLQALRQLNHDRRLALPLVEETLRTGRSDRVSVERRFVFPAAENHLPPITLEHASHLAGLAGYFATLENQALYLCHERRVPSQCPVQLSASGGVLRGWTVPGEDLERRWPGERHAFVRKVLQHLRTFGPALTRPQFGRLLERLNALNDASGLLRYVWSGGKVLAMAVYTPAEREMSVDEFQVFADALFRCARDGSREMSLIRQAV